MSGISLAGSLHIDENKCILTHSWWDSIRSANSRLAVLGVPVQLSFRSTILDKAVVGWMFTTQCKDFDSNLFLQF